MVEIEPSRKTQKSEIRRELRELRAAVKDEQRRALDAEINRWLLEYAETIRPSVIGAFRSFDGEPDIEPALRLLERRGATLALPVIHQDPAKLTITFHHWYSGAEMQANRYGIEEPLDTAEIRLVDIDLVLVPLVAWD